MVNTDKLYPFKGFIDKLGHDIDVQDYVELTISALARNQEWIKYKPPVIERLDTFSEDVTGWLGYSNRKFILSIIPDLKDNEIYNYGIMIPEGTASVCRLIAKEIVENGYDNFSLQFPLKLFYVIRCFRNESNLDISKTKLKEFGQIGFEYIGSEYPNPDAEIIALAMDCLKSIDVPENYMKIRLGDVNIFREISKDVRDLQTKEIMQNCLDGLSKARAIRAYDEFEVLKQNIKKLFSPYMSSKSLKLLCDEVGDIQLIENIENELCISLDQSKQVLEKLNSAGLIASFEPAVTRGWAYYTGSVFQIDIMDEKIVYPEIAGGGRYDALICKFLKQYGLKANIPATGFAFGTERLEELFKKYGCKDKLIKLQRW